MLRTCAILVQTLPLTRQFLQTWSLFEYCLLLWRQSFNLRLRILFSDNLIDWFASESRYFFNVVTFELERIYLSLGSRVSI